MAITPRLDLRQGQALVMTPQLQQSIKLLQLSNLELSSYVDQEVEQNPLLDRDDPNQTESDAGDEFANAGEPVASDSALKLTDDTPDGLVNQDLDAGAADTWQGEDAPPGPNPDLGGGERASSSGVNWQDNGPDIEQAAAFSGTMRDHLLTQVGLEFHHPADRLIASYLVDMVDEAGYLVGELEVAARALGCTPERVEETLHRLQRFEPIGIFARDLAECLALQLAERGELNRAMSLLVGNLDQLAMGEVGRLRKICGVDNTTLAAMVSKIKSLNPKPGLAFDHEVAQPIIPDVFVKPGPDQGWLIELNTDTLPRVMVNTTYYAQLSGTASLKEDKAFISACFQNANWLVRSIDQRARTIIKVSTELVRWQEDFFRKGLNHLKPLTLRDVADTIEMHESTVSRVSNNKYMATPRGIFELKFFFSAGLASTTGGEQHAAEAVRHRIKELIARETVDEILSDDRIADALSRAGIDIARRTVAKYREGMHIPSSVRRRRLKARSAQGI